MDDSSTKRQRQEQRQFVRSGSRSTPGSARGRRLGFDVGASSRRTRATAPDRSTTASWNGCRRPNNGDADAPHVVLSRRGTSTAQRPLISSTPQRRQFTVDGGPLGLTTQEVVAPTRLTASTSATSQQDIRQNVRSGEQITSNCPESRVFLSTLE